MQTQVKQLRVNTQVLKTHTYATKWVKPYRKGTQTTSTEMPLWTSKFEDLYLPAVVPCRVITEISRYHFLCVFQLILIWSFHQFSNKPGSKINTKKGHQLSQFGLKIELELNTALETCVYLFIYKCEIWFLTVKNTVAKKTLNLHNFFFSGWKEGLTFGNSRHENSEDPSSENHSEGAFRCLWTNAPCWVPIFYDATRRKTWNSSSTHSPPK